MFEEINDEPISFAKPAFNKIPEEKKKRIIKTAMSEFAENGLAATNINVVAKKADISIGSLYNYFETKEDLFLTIAHQGLRQMVGTVMVSLVFSDNLATNLKTFLKVLIRFICDEKELALLYNNIAYRTNVETTLSAHKYAKDNLMKIYTEVITETQQKGYIRNDVDYRVIIFLLDAVFSSIRHAYTTDDENSLCLFICNDVKNDVDYFTDQLARLIQPALSPSGKEYEKIEKNF